MPDETSVKLKDELVAVARKAGAVILDIYNRDFETLQKADRSPVTEADTAAETVILEALARLAPDVPAVAEEQCAKDGIPLSAPKRFFLVDPLDGTKEFIARNGEFTVNIALIEDGRPVLGVVYLPVTDACYAGHNGKAERSVGGGALEPITVRTTPENGLAMAISRSHADGRGRAGQGARLQRRGHHHRRELAQILPHRRRRRRSLSAFRHDDGMGHRGGPGGPGSGRRPGRDHPTARRSAMASRVSATRISSHTGASARDRTGPRTDAREPRTGRDRLARRQVGRLPDRDGLRPRAAMLPATARSRRSMRPRAGRASIR